MNTGKTLFAQLMDFLPWTTFTRIVDRYGGDHRVRTLSCAEQYRSMAFAQLTYRKACATVRTTTSCRASIARSYSRASRWNVVIALRVASALAQRVITSVQCLDREDE